MCTTAINGCFATVYCAAWGLISQPCVEALLITFSYSHIAPPAHIRAYAIQSTIHSFFSLGHLAEIEILWRNLAFDYSAWWNQAARLAYYYSPIFRVTSVKSDNMPLITNFHTKKFCFISFVHVHNLTRKLHVFKLIDHIKAGRSKKDTTFFRCSVCRSGSWACGCLA